MAESQGASPEQTRPPSSPRNNAISRELLWEGKLSKRRQWNLLQLPLGPKGQNGLFRNRTWQRCYSTGEAWRAGQAEHSAGGADGRPQRVPREPEEQKCHGGAAINQKSPLATRSPGLTLRGCMETWTKSICFSLIHCQVSQMQALLQTKNGFQDLSPSCQQKVSKPERELPSP